MSYPFMLAVPRVDLIKVARICIGVVLPAPFGPRSPKPHYRKSPD
jgi:hypothetical protein